MSYSELQYLSLLSRTLDLGTDREDRTGVGVRSLFAPPSLTFLNVDQEFPLLTTKKMAWKSILAETLWFLQGRSDLESLRADGCTWWDDWEKEDGTLGPVYGKQLRHWQKPDGTEHDQLAWIIDEIKANPTSRRLVATMWNAGELEEMALPPCHGALMQFYVDGNFLDLHVNIRSSDLFLGLPTNIASYSLVLLILARETELKGRNLIVTLGDAHIYNNHMEAVRTQIRRKPSPLPQVAISGVESLDDLRPDNFHLIDYNPQDKITAPIAV